MSIYIYTQMRIYIYIYIYTLSAFPGFKNIIFIMLLDTMEGGHPTFVFFQT